MMPFPGRGMGQKIASRRALLLRTLAIAGLCALLFTLIVKLVLLRTSAQDISTLKTREQARVETAAGMLEYRLEILEMVTLFLSRAPAVKQAAQAAQASWEAGSLPRVEALFLALMDSRDSYAQVRLLDEQGRERVRVERAGTTAVPAATLQDKSGRYYVQDIAELAAGEVYLSPLDLNIENFLIEVPYRPMLRAGTPLFDRHGERRGSLVINFDATTLLDRLRQILGGTTRPMLLNWQGDWLVGPAEQEWGFMFGTPGAFARRHPDAWQTMREQGSGHVSTDEGLLTYSTVTPLSPGHLSATGSALAFGRSQQRLTHDAYVWRVGALVPGDALPSAALLASPVRRLVYLLGLAVTLLVSGATTWLFAMRREAQRQARQEAYRHRQITDHLAEGLLVVDRQGEIEEANPEAERLLVWRREALLGEHARRVMPSLWEQCDRFQGITASGEPYRSDQVSFVRRDGAHLPVDVSAAPLRHQGDVSAIIVAFSDITERLQQERAIRHLAYHDTLTGLPNRRLLLERLELAMAACRRHRRSMALIFLDLDHFKAINDTHGHEAGDALLKEVAKRLLQVTRETDVVSRQGGDEFVILLGELHAPEDAARVAQLLLARLGDPLTIGDATLPIGASIGAALYPEDGDSADTLMKAADAAMYRAKQAGRHRYCVSGDRPRELPRDLTPQAGQ
ncbi:diguanylate cyclase domain-containing protein [Halomonas sp. 1390]|uniref:diguanylate cyclase domain-containing protein n=1 Tax=Halomonas sp. B23F22_3 TaxID=3459516 RepID=UPI00373E9EE6